MLKGGRDATRSGRLPLHHGPLKKIFNYVDSIQLSKNNFTGHGRRPIKTLGPYPLRIRANPIGATLIIQTPCPCIRKECAGTDEGITDGGKHVRGPYIKIGPRQEAIDEPLDDVR
jgi:hypothetical protein